MARCVSLGWRDPDALFEAGEQAAAAGVLLSAERRLSASPRDPVVRLNLGNVVRDLGRPAEAKAHHLAALDAEPGFAEAHFNLGHLALGAGQHAEAIAYSKRAFSPTQSLRIRSTICLRSISKLTGLATLPR